MIIHICKDGFWRSALSRADERVVDRDDSIISSFLCSTSSHGVYVGDRRRLALAYQSIARNHSHAYIPFLVIRSVSWNQSHKR